MSSLCAAMCKKKNPVSHELTFTLVIGDMAQMEHGALPEPASGHSERWRGWMRILLECLLYRWHRGQGSLSPCSQPWPFWNWATWCKTHQHPMSFFQKPAIQMLHSTCHGHSQTKYQSCSGYIGGHCVLHIPWMNLVGSDFRPNSV